MRYFFRLLLLLSVFALLVLFIHKIAVWDAAIQPLITAVLRDPTCPQPCWHGITVGQTTLDQAKAILQADQQFFTNVNGDTSMVNVAIPSAHVSAEVMGFPNATGKIIVYGIHIGTANETSHLTIGDAILLFGAPQGTDIKICGGGDIRITIATLVMSGNIEIKTEPLDKFRVGGQNKPFVNITPQTPLNSIIYTASDGTGTMPNWTGFRSWQGDKIPYAELGICYYN